jgi:hypothetical protein
MLTTQDPNPTAKKPFILWRPFLAVWHWLVPPTLAHADRQSSTARWVSAGLIVVFSLGLVVTGLTYGRSWAKGYKQMRARSYMKEAHKYEIQADDFVEQNKTIEAQQAYVMAIKNANEAYKLDNENIDCVRFWAKSETRAKHGPNAMWLWKRLGELTTLTDDDQAWRIQSFAVNSEDKQAADQIEKTLQSSTPSKKAVLTAVEIFDRLGRQQQLLDMLRNVGKKNPDNADLQLVLSMRLVQIGSDEDQKNGLKKLWEIAGRDDEIGLKALEFIDTVKILSLDEQQRLSDRIDHHPLAKEVHHIVALKRRAALETDGKKREAIYAKAIDDRRSVKREDLPPLIRWLNEENQCQRVVDFLRQREDQVREYKPLLQNYLNALTRLDRTADLERLVKDKRTDLSTSERNFHLVHLAYVLKKPNDDLRKALLEALESAVSDGQVAMLIQIGAWAETRGLLDESKKAFEAASVHQRTEREGYEGLIRVSYKLGDTDAYFKAVREAAKRWSENQFFSDQYLYAALLMGTEMESSMGRVEKLLDARPKDSQRKLMMALALYRQKDPKESARYLNNISLSDLSIGQGAVLCGIMREAGFAMQAAQIAQQIPPEVRMLPEEQRFLSRVKALTQTP